MIHPTTHRPALEIEAHIRDLYHTYRHTPSVNAKGFFFSPTCLQVCRPTPSYSATSRSQIVQYLKDAQQGKVPLNHDATSEDSMNSSNDGEPKSIETGRYTIRPLSLSEYEFGSEAATAAIGYTPVGLKAKAEAEGWVGMRVDLWNAGAEAGLLVKVQYWWRLEASRAREEEDEGRVPDESNGKVWRQCLHDIVYLGPRDGTEGEQGLQVLR